MATSVHAVRAYRLSQNPPLKLEDLAREIGTTTANLSRIETGKQVVSDVLLPKIIAATGIPAGELRPDLAKLFSIAGRVGSGKPTGARRSRAAAA